jgi:hypothetical protein
LGPDWHESAYACLHSAGREVGFTLGLDLGQLGDYSAAAVVERSAYPDDRPPTFDVRHLRRWPLRTPYPQVVADVLAMLAAPELRGARLAIDATGVGRPVTDMFRDGLEGAGLDGSALVAVTITSGRSCHYEGREWHVSKLLLCGLLQSLIGTSRLRIAKGDALAEELVKELLAFKVRVSPAGNEQFGAFGWREGSHDDLVLGMATALWAANRDANYRPQLPILLTPPQGGGPVEADFWSL